MAKTNENGFLICPRCGKKTNTKVLPETELKNAKQDGGNVTFTCLEGKPDVDIDVIVEVHV